MCRAGGDLSEYAPLVAACGKGGPLVQNLQPPPPPPRTSMNLRKFTDPTYGNFRFGWGRKQFAGAAGGTRFCLLG